MGRPRTRFEKVKEADTRRTWRDTGHYFVLEDKEYDCLFSATDNDSELSEDGAGIFPVYDLTATVIASDLPSPLSSLKGKKVTADGQTYQIETTQKIPFSVLAKISFVNLDV